MDQYTDTATNTTQALTAAMTPPAEPNQQQPATPTGDVFQCAIEKFNGTTGMIVGDFIRNVEADGKLKNLVGDAFDKHCVALARNRIDLTKSKRVADVTRLIDVQPDHSKDWAFVKDVLFASFGQNNTSAEYALGTLLKEKPDDYTTAGLATYISNIRARLQEWVTTETPPEMTDRVNTNRETTARINKFLATTLLTMFVPESERRNASKVLRETKMEQLAHKTAKLLRNATPVEVFTAQDATHSPKPTQLGTTRQ